jgi:hypothetical protein
MDDYNLPSTYGKSRLVLLAVHPYLIHAYWEIAPKDFAKAKEEAGAQSQEVLRFYKMSRAAGRETLGEWFDVEIDFQSRNWYVHLWSAEESYFADLALKRDDGTLVRLVRSQIVYMPRSHPAIPIEQHFMKVDSTERRVEIVPPPPIEHERPQEIALPVESEVAEPMPEPVVSDETVIEKIEQVYAVHELEHDGLEPDIAPVLVTVTPPAATWRIDLAGLAEQNLATGFSSVLLQKVTDGASITTK